MMADPKATGRSALEPFTELFAEATNLLAQSRYDAFLDKAIEARTLLKTIPYSDTAMNLVPIERWRTINERFESLFEWRSAIDLLVHDISQQDWLDSSGPNFLGVKADLAALKEIRREAPRSLTMVGSGAFPQTLFFLAANLQHCRLTGLDNAPERAYLAMRLARKFEATRQMVLLPIPGEEHDYVSEDVVVIASLVIGKRAVLARIAETAAPGTVLLMRFPAGWGTAFYEGVEPNILRDVGFSPELAYRPAKDSFFQTQLYVKER